MLAELQRWRREEGERTQKAEASWLRTARFLLQENLGAANGMADSVSGRLVRKIILH